MHTYKVMAGDVTLMEITIGRVLTLDDILQDYIFTDYSSNQISLIEVV